MLLVHDLMLLLLDDESGRQRPVAALTELLGGALLVELAAAGVVGVAAKSEPGDIKEGRLVLRPGVPVLAGLLEEAARIVGEYVGKKPDRALRSLGKGLRERVTADLVEAGILAEQEHKTLGLFRSTRHPAVSTTYEDDLRARLAAVLEGQAGPEEKTGPLIALLHASGQLPKIIPVHDKKQAKAIATKISEGNWAAASVRRAVQAGQTAAIVATTFAATAAAINN
ncbi:GPP34 family phosphoprotein [uncultured Jatrophihabitans sp.]|uniref:GOLPH3/VPS74 family protein n=1 Tax=uncultured Jatrophihabitans sp. TaxID=1610747 RepID=UPI0035C9A208